LAAWRETMFLVAWWETISNHFNDYL
jgi:hypothetical protein